MAIELFDVLTFSHATAEDVDITTTDPDWTDLLNLDTPALPSGVYALVFVLQFSLASTSQSFMYRFSTDGGTTWGPIYQKEVKDRSNIEIIEVLDIVDHTAGDLDVAVQVTREGSADCNIRKAIIACERKA